MAERNLKNIELKLDKIDSIVQEIKELIGNHTEYCDMEDTDDGIPVFEEDIDELEEKE
jgi:peptidoglycan hydrolase CwlO-like protein